MSAPLRPIGALDLPDLRPADLTKQAVPMLEWIDVDELRVDPAYQRDLTPKARRLVAQLVEGWDWLRCGPLLVALVGDHFEVYDGQSRATAGKLHPQIESLPCYVVDGSTLPQRAGAFVAHARDRVPVTPGQVWHAAVTAGDEEAVAIAAACAAARVELLATNPESSAYRPRQTVALATIRTVLRRRGPERLRAALAAAGDAELAPLSSDHIKIADAFLHGEDYAGEFDGEAVTALLRALTPALRAEAQALSVAKHLPVWRAQAAVLYRHRDKRRPRAAAPDLAQVTPPPARDGRAAGDAQAVQARPEAADDAGAATRGGQSRGDLTRAEGHPAALARAGEPRSPAVAPPPAPRAAPLRQLEAVPARPARAQQIVDLPGMPPPGRSALDQRRAQGERR